MTSKQAKQNFGKIVKSPCRVRKILRTFTRKLGQRGIGDAIEFFNEWESFYKPVEGLLIGTRTYRSGNCGRPFYMQEYVVRSTLEVALIVTNFRRKPIPVPLEKCVLFGQQIWLTAITEK